MNCKWRILNLVYLEIRAASKTNRKANSGDKTKKNRWRNYLIAKDGLRDFPAQVSLSWSFPIADKPKISVFPKIKFILLIFFQSYVAPFLTGAAIKNVKFWFYNMINDQDMT